jgi:hypothetical protein
VSRKHRQRKRGGPALEDADRTAGPWLEPGEGSPGLLLFVGSAPAELDAALATGAVAALVADPSAVPAWRERCGRHGVALLALDDPAVAGVDGVHLGDPGGIAAAREHLGPGRIVGAACGRSRHAGMVAGETGADYVMFGDLDRAPVPGDELFELVRWWSELFVIPCAAAAPLDLALARALVGAGADLLASRPPDEGVEAIARAVRGLPQVER